MIEQAGCLAAIAIEHDVEAGHRAGLRVHGKPPMRGRVLEWPISTTSPQQEINKCDVRPAAEDMPSWVSREGQRSEVTC